MFLDELIKHFLWTLQCEKHISQNSVQSYSYDMRVFKDFFQLSKSDLMDQNLVSNFYFFLKEKNRMLPTIIRRINLLINFLRFCKDEKGFDIQIPDNNIKLDKSYRPFLESKDFVKIRDFLKEKTKKNIRLNCIIEVLYSTGMRISELLNINLDDLNEIYTKKSLIIQGKGGVYRIVFFNDFSIEAIKTYVYDFNPKSKLIKLTRQRVFQLLKDLAFELNIESSLLFPHTFRHRMLTDLLQKGMDLVSVQKIAGHKQISTTERYTHVEEYLYDEILKHHPLKKELVIQ